MDWLRIAVNLSTKAGHESLNWLTCDMIRMPNPAISKNARNMARTMAIFLFTLCFTKKSTMGLSTMEMTMAKTSGTTMNFVMYSIVNRAKTLTKQMVIFA